MTDEVKLVGEVQVEKKVMPMMSLDDQLAEAKKQVAELETQLKVVRSSLAATDEKLEVNRKAREALDKALEEKEGFLKNLRADRKTLVRELEDVKGISEMKSRDLQKLDERIEKLKAMNDALHIESVKQQNRYVIAERSRKDTIEQIDYVQKIQHERGRLRAEYDEAYRIMREAAFLGGGQLTVERMEEIEPEVKKHVKSFKELVLRANEFGLVLENPEECDGDWDVAFAAGRKIAAAYADKKGNEG